jgi:mannose-1-phosphate guanylyltransferase
MKLVLLSGGSGKRLWPLSNETRSKQFLKVLEAPNGKQESMVQRVWRQLGYAGLNRDAYISTGSSQVEMLQAQLGIDVPLIVEPERRDTFPAIALAATYLYSVAGVGLGETIAVLPVDPYVDDDFFTRLLTLEHLLQHTEAKIGLIGIEPDGPSSKFGYIVPKPGASTSEEAQSYVRVSHFVEKPRYPQAEALLRQGSLWNSGVFAFRLNYMIQLMIDRGLPIQYEEMLKAYHKLPKISFDYEVLEKESNIIAITYDGCWEDLGTWNALAEHMPDPIRGKAIVSEDCKGVHIINELDIPIALAGMKDMIVAASPDGILVSSKEASPGIKDVVQYVEQRPMYEERRWGWYKVLDFSITSEGRQTLTKRLCIHGGKHLSYQMHEKRDEVWTIISGSGEVVLDERLMPVKTGDVLHIPAGTRHSVRAKQDLEIIEVQTGSLLIEEDITRLIMNWEEILQQCSARISLIDKSLY